MSMTAFIFSSNKEDAIGSIIIKAKKFIDNIIVIDNGSTDNTVEIAYLAGAKIINNNKFETVLKNSRENGAKIVFILNADNRYIDIIPETINYINNGYDMVVISQKRISNTKFLAFSIESLKGNIFNVHHIEDIILQAEKNNLRIKFLDCLDSFNKNIGIVVPAFNEEKFIEKTIRNIPQYIKKIYVIDDCSTDKTSEIVNNIKDPRILYIEHDKNKGVGAAIITGYKLALEENMDIVAVMAGDDQMDPGELPKLLKPIIEDHADYTKGNRLINKNFRQGMSRWRSFGNALLTMITKIGSGYWHIMDPQNGYTAISKKALEAIDLDSIYPYYGYCNDLLIKMNTFGLRVEDVAIPARYGNEISKIKYSKYIIRVSLMIFNGFLWRLKTKYMILDFHPLVFFYFASMVLLPFGTTFGMWILAQKFYHDPVSQNYPLLAVFITLAGLQLLLFAMLFDMQENKK